MPDQPRFRALPRRLGVGLVLLALWLQALAPAAALSARARAAAADAADALIHAALCGRDPGRDAGAADAADPMAAELPAAPADCGRCPLCRCTAVAPLPAASEPVSRPLRWRPAAWPTPPPLHEPRPPRKAGLARAPPEPV